jgi:hypothetical protein
MAASYSLTLQCRICGTKITITNTTDAAVGNTKENVYNCGNCGVALPFMPTSLALVHSGNVGSNTTITHTVTIPGSIASAVS